VIEMQWLKVLALVAALAGTLLAACTLIERPGSYYDPTNRLVTLVSVPSVEVLVLTNSNVYFLVGGSTQGSGSSLQAVPKAGGDTSIIWTTKAGAVLTTLASDEKSRVSWCDSTKGVYILDESNGATPALVANSTGCTAIAVSPARMVYATSDGDAGSFVHTVESDAATSALPITARTINVALAENDTYYLTADDRLARERLTSDTTPDFFCTLGVETDVTGTRIIAVDAGQPVESPLFFGLSFIWTTPQAQCCQPDGSGCVNLTGIVGGIGASRTAIHGGQLYNCLLDIRRVPLSLLIDNPTVIDGGQILYSNVPAANNLAVDDTYAFFSQTTAMQGDQILRLVLDPADGGS
jgi:hypothetical protein